MVIFNVEIGFWIWLLWRKLLCWKLLSWFLWLKFVSLLKCRLLFFFRLVVRFRRLLRVLVVRFMVCCGRLLLVRSVDCLFFVGDYEGDGRLVCRCVMFYFFFYCLNFEFFMFGYFDLLYGVILEKLFIELVVYYGWVEFGKWVDICCFRNDLSIKFSFVFLCKMFWVWEKVEVFYV